MRSVASRQVHFIQFSPKVRALSESTERDQHPTTNQADLALAAMLCPVLLFCQELSFPVKTPQQQRPTRQSPRGAKKPSGAPGEASDGAGNTQQRTCFGSATVKLRGMSPFTAQLRTPIN